MSNHISQKIKTVLCDTNIIVRYLVDESSIQDERVTVLLDQVQAGQIKAFVLESVFTETVFVLDKIYHVPRLKLAQALKGLLQYRFIINDAKSIWVEALNIYSSTKLHIVDCLLIAQVQYHQFELITFDQELQKIAHRYQSEAIKP